MGSTAINVVLGCMAFGDEGRHLVRVHDPAEARDMLRVFKAHGHRELDTARIYGEGSSEAMLCALEVHKQGFSLATKCYPTASLAVAMQRSQYTHRADDLTRSLDESLAALGVATVDVFYLHAPDRTVPFEETLRAVNDNHRAGRFARFGLSNYRADEVEQIAQICTANSWVKPAIYQGVFNAIAQNAEPELFPVLRRHSIAFYAYSPLAGGFFSGKYQKDESVKENRRFDDSTLIGKAFRARYWKDSYFEALEQLRIIAEEHEVTLPEIGMRWLMHHSILRRADGDAIVVGASSATQLEQNLVDLEKGPLTEAVVAAVDRAWQLVAEDAPKYHS